MEQTPEHSKELLLAAATVVVAGSLYGPNFVEAHEAATDLALSLKKAGYFEEDALDLLDYALDELDGKLDDSLFFKQSVFPKRLWNTIRVACHRVGHALTSPATRAQVKAELAEYAERRAA